MSKERKVFACIAKELLKFSEIRNHAQNGGLGYFFSKEFFREHIGDDPEKWLQAEGLEKSDLDPHDYAVIERVVKNIYDAKSQIEMSMICDMASKVSFVLGDRILGKKNYMFLVDDKYDTLDFNAYFRNTVGEGYVLIYVDPYSRHSAFENFKLRSGFLDENSKFKYINDQFISLRI